MGNQAARKKYYWKNREKYLEKKAEYRNSFHGKAVFLLAAAKKRSRAQNKECALTVDWIEERLEQGCSITGHAFVFGQGSRGPFSASIDKINPKGIYSPDNCRLVIWAINAAIGDWGFETAKEIWQRICTKPKNM